jgi:hypothetical protein
VKRTHRLDRLQNHQCKSALPHIRPVAHATPLVKP